MQPAILYIVEEEGIRNWSTYITNEPAASILLAAIVVYNLQLYTTLYRRAFPLYITRENATAEALLPPALPPAGSPADGNVQRILRYVPAPASISRRAHHLFAARFFALYRTEASMKNYRVVLSLARRRWLHFVNIIPGACRNGGRASAWRQPLCGHHDIYNMYSVWKFDR